MAARRYFAAAALALIFEIVLLPLWLIMRISGKNISLKEFHKNAYNKNLSQKTSLILALTTVLVFMSLILYALSQIDRYY